MIPSRIIGEQRADGNWPESERKLEISTPDGQSWQPFTPLPTVGFDSGVHLFVIQGELMISGVDVELEGSRKKLQWFDAKEKQWVTLWQEKDFTPMSDRGRVIIRQLPNGKRLVIPMEGL
jgi:hypothetical protein